MAESVALRARTAATLNPAIELPGPSSGTWNGTNFLENLTVGAQPTEVALDTQNHYLYVSDFGPPPPAALGNCATIINGTTNQVLATIAVGDDPLTVEYDPGDGYVYVNDYGVGQNVTVISGLRTIASIPVGASPADGVYDPTNHDLYIVNRVSDNLSIVNGLSVVASLGTGQSPASDLYDPANGFVYVANGASNNVTIINGTSVIANVGTGTRPNEMAYDPANEDVVVANSGSGNLTLLRNTSVVGSIAVPGTPYSVTYDPANGFLYVPNPTANSVDVVSSSSIVGNVSVGGGPRFAALDTANGFLYVDNWLDGNVSIIDNTTLIASVVTGPEPWETFYDPLNHDVYAPEYGGYASATGTSNLTVVGGGSTPYSIEFQETGLPLGENWSVEMGATTYVEDGSHFTVDEPNGTYAYYVPRATGYAATVSYGNVTLATANATVTIDFQPTYPVTFTEVGLLSNTTWGGSMDGVSATTTSDNFTLPEPNGTSSYHLAPVPGYLTNWTGQATVSGAPLAVPVVFQTTTYPARFTESGLPAGTNWSVEVGAQSFWSTSGLLVAPLPNGTFGYRIPGIGPYEPQTATGVVTIYANGTSTSVAFYYSYALDFNETGLPAGTNWTISIAGSVYTQSAPALDLFEPNGSYEYTIVPIPGYSTTWNGRVTIAGAPEAVAINFTRVTYALTFEANGLPSGTEWGVEVNGSELTSTSEDLVANLPNGTYMIVYSSAGSYAIANAPPSVVTLRGEGELIPIYFRPTYLLSFTEVGVPAGLNWSVTVVSSEFVFVTEKTVSSTAPTLSVEEPSGTYTYSFSSVPGFVTPAAGSVTVGTAPVEVDVAYTAFAFPVTFEESGLPPRTVWNVTLDGAVLGSSSSVITADLTNGTHVYLIDPVPGYFAAWTGRVNVSGTAQVVNVTFLPAVYPVVVTERGLPVGTRWGAEVGNANASSTTASVTLLLANGTYGLFAENLSGYSTPAAGIVVVDGGPPGPVVVEYTASSPTTVGALRLAPEDGLAIGLVVAALAVSAGLLVLRRRRRA
jgi:YVTN family beta-propeller protein